MAIAPAQTVRLAMRSLSRFSREMWTTNFARWPVRRIPTLLQWLFNKAFALKASY